mgnify:CR=1 FL=1
MSIVKNKIYSKISFLSVNNFRSVIELISLIVENKCIKQFQFRFAFLFFVEICPLVVKECTLVTRHLFEYVSFP